MRPRRTWPGYAAARSRPCPRRRSPSRSWSTTRAGTCPRRC